MTGDPCEIYKIKSDITQEMIKNNQLWDKIFYADSVGYLLTASTPSVLLEKDNGLIPSHSYSLIVAKVLSNGIKLVLLRNPWGQKEWEGNWSDTSPLWTIKYKEEVKNAKHDFNNKNDGMFWIMYDDLIKYFDKIVICSCRTPGQHPKPWKETRTKTFFSYSTDTKNVFLSSILKIIPIKNTMAVITIFQTNIRIQGSKPYIDIGFTVLKIIDDNEDIKKIKYEYIGGIGCKTEHEVSQEIPLLEAGCKYLIVPLTTGGKFREQDAMKLENTFNQALYHNNELSLIGLRIVDEIFDRFDMKMQQALGIPALHWILKIIKPTMSPVEVRNIYIYIYIF